MLNSVNFGCFAPSRGQRFHCSSMRKVIKTHKSWHTIQQNGHIPLPIQSIYECTGSMYAFSKLLFKGLGFYFPFTMSSSNWQTFVSSADIKIGNYRLALTWGVFVLLNCVPTLVFLDCFSRSITMEVLTLMAYFHQRRWTQIWTQIPTPFLMVTLYYAEIFSTGSDSDPCRESFLNGYCTHFRDRSPSLFHTFESGDQSPNLNQWKNLHSTRICVGI